VGGLAMRKLSVLFLVILFIFSILILPQKAYSITSNSDNQVGYIQNAFVVKFSSGFEGVNLETEKMIVLTGIWQLDALNQYFRVDMMEPVSPMKITQSEIPGKSRYYLLKCHPLVSLEEVMDNYLGLSFVDNVELLNNNSKFYLYSEDQNSESAKDKPSDSVKKPSTDIPQKFSISQNYPNPFNTRTLLSISLPAETHVSLVVYNIMGQKVKVLVDDFMSAGIHTITWDGTNESGQTVSSGVYFYRVVTQENVVNKKMVLIK
jgi:hypothetical protein